MLGLVLSSVYYFGVAQASGASLVPLPNSVPLTGTSAKAIGHHDPNALLTVGIVLQLSDPAGQQSLLQSSVSYK